jgi:hypothetical protein
VRSIVLKSSSAAPAALVTTRICGAMVVIAVAATMTAKMTLIACQQWPSCACFTYVTT